MILYSEHEPVEAFRNRGQPLGIPSRDISSTISPYVNVTEFEFGIRVRALNGIGKAGQAIDAKEKDF